MFYDKFLMLAIKASEPHTPVRAVADAASAGVFVSAAMGWLPIVSAVLAIPAALYYVILGIEKWKGKPFHEIIK